MYRFYVEQNQIKENSICILDSDVNHIKNVLRMSRGDTLIACDGQGKDYICSITDLSDKIVELSINQVQNSFAELEGRIYLFQGLPKKDKMELIIQKAVELGVYEIIPVMTMRTVVKLEDKKKELKKLERWQAIATSAAKQSGRGIIPRIIGTKTLKEALAYGSELDCRFIPYENAKGIDYTRKVIADIQSKHKVGIIIGPEGGFEEKEIALAKEAGYEPVTLGKRILRTETAGLAILSMIMLHMET